MTCLFFNQIKHFTLFSKYDTFTLIIIVERENNMAVSHFSWTSDKLTEASGDYAEIKYDTSATIATDNADKYVFEVRRYKDVATREEYLNVRVFDAATSNNGISKASNNICAEIERANIIELESKLLNLRIYGVLLGRKHFPKVRQLIEIIYPDLPARPVNNSTVLTSTVVDGIYEMFAEYIIGIGMTPDNGLYNIPVTEFKEYIEDTVYSKYKYSDIRAELANFSKTINGKDIKGTKCSFRRNDNTVAKGDKHIKVISFVSEVVDSYRNTKLPQG